jgi:hypothetical protein
LIGISANPLLSQSNLKYPKIPQLNVLSARQAISDQIECFLDYLEHLMLDEAGVVTDLYNNVPFCQVSHQDSFQMSGFLWHSR